jgi:hypothetical protein
MAKQKSKVITASVRMTVRPAELRKPKQESEHGRHEDQQRDRDRDAQRPRR